MRWLLLLIAVLATSGCKTTEIVVAHHDSGLTVTTRFDTSEAAMAMHHQDRVAPSVTTAQTPASHGTGTSDASK